MTRSLRSRRIRGRLLARFGEIPRVQRDFLDAPPGATCTGKSGACGKPAVREMVLRTPKGKDQDPQVSVHYVCADHLRVLAG